MKKQKPKIQLSKWMFAANPEESRKIQSKYEGDSFFWLIWKKCSAEILPAELRKHLLKMGIELDCPTKWHEYKKMDVHGWYIEVFYYAVGKILSGPKHWNVHGMNYLTVRETPYVSLVLYAPSENDYEDVISFENSKKGDLVRVRLRLLIPIEIISNNMKIKHYKQKAMSRTLKKFLIEHKPQHQRAIQLIGKCVEALEEDEVKLAIEHYYCFIKSCGRDGKGVFDDPGILMEYDHEEIEYVDVMYRSILLAWSDNMKKL